MGLNDFFPYHLKILLIEDSRSLVDNDVMGKRKIHEIPVEVFEFRMI